MVDPKLISVIFKSEKKKKSTKRNIKSANEILLVWAKFELELLLFYTFIYSNSKFESHL